MHDKMQVLFGNSYMYDSLTCFPYDELIMIITYELFNYYLFNNNNRFLWVHVVN